VVSGIFRIGVHKNGGKMNTKVLITKRNRHSEDRELGGTPEQILWGEVILNAIDDFKISVVLKKNSEGISRDRCNPENWIFGKNTGFDIICEYLNIKPDIIRRHLRKWKSDIDSGLGY